MALIEISETQLAFGYLHSYMNVHRVRRFILPSLGQEGGRGRFQYPGADVILNNNHLIQFKRPFHFITNGIKEFWNYSKPHDINPPYFRFYIKNDNPTTQLDKLVTATIRGLSAEYITPLFQEEGELFRLLRNDRVHLQSYAHIDISQFRGMASAIGNNNDHTIIYTAESINKGFCYCFSEPKQIKGYKTNDNQMRQTGQSFNSFELVQIISSIFFNDNYNSFTKSDNPYYDCLVLQRRLFVEMDIVWTFNL